MKNKKGGKVIASGGFGCVFDPPIECSNNTNTFNTNQISKLMLQKNAEDEYRQIDKYNSLLNVIPNYQNYFLINNFSLCKPSKLTKNDLQNYQKKCKTLKKRGINVKNINNSLDKLLIINMPNGGIDVESFVEQYFVPSNIVRLNNSLIDLLTNGIIPMNKLNVYHCDIKDSNVLVQITETGLNTRLIDWGLSFVWNKQQAGIPRNIYRRPFQYNVPFSSILFNKDFIKLYTDFLLLNPQPVYYEIREFVVNYIFIWNNIRGSGHLSAINEMMKKLIINDLKAIEKPKIKEHLIEYDFTYYYIIEYLSKILEKYTNNGEVNLMVYFNDIFLKNIDIWGFIMIYIAFYEKLYKSYNELNEYKMMFISKIKYILIHFLYETPTEIINVSLLIDELTKLNNIAENFDMNQMSKKQEYYSKLKKNIGGFIKYKKRTNKTNTYKKNYKKYTKKRR